MVMNVTIGSINVSTESLRALEVRFSRRGAIQIYVYLYLYVLALDLEGVHDVKLHHPSSSVATSNQ